MDHKVIFIVEDEGSIRMICKRLLAQMGHAAVFAKDVQDATQKLADMKRVDLLVTDMRLPDGDGVEVIAKLRQKFSSAKVLVITGSPVPEFRLERLYEMGFRERDVLPKPFEIGQFIAEVQRCLEGGQCHDS
ncbi:MAG: response regulator [Elusimicrobia bacterium]|nr:response regulator [Elusimicrobiota bacterium]